MFFRYSILPILVSSFCFLPHADAQLSINLDQGKGEVEFRAKGHPNAIKIVRKGSAPHGVLNIEGQKVTGKVSFDLSSLDTGIKLRTRHMREKYLEVERFPEAVLT